MITIPEPPLPPLDNAHNGAPPPPPPVFANPDFGGVPSAVAELPPVPPPPEAKPDVLPASFEFDAPPPPPAY